MSPPISFEFQLTSPDKTTALAQAIAPVLRAGDVLLLHGEIGAGKTHFARSVIQARLQAVDLMEDVPSPTFTLVQTYDDGITEIWHADLYRLLDVQDAIELGLSDAFHQSICLVEWPEILETIAPANAIKLLFSAGPTDDSRDLTISIPSDSNQALISSLQVLELGD